MATRREAFDAIDSERSYQQQQWGDNPLTIGEFLLLVEEYVSKARAIWSKEPKPEVETLQFVRKIGGIAVNCLEQHGAPNRRSSPSC